MRLKRLMYETEQTKSSSNNVSQHINLSTEHQSESVVNTNLNLQISELKLRTLTYKLLVSFSSYHTNYEAKRGRKEQKEKTASTTKKEKQKKEKP